MSTSSAHPVPGARQPQAVWAEPGREHRQASLAGRWMAAPLQFCIPFLPDKPRRIFINQSATLFNKNLLTYK